MSALRWITRGETDVVQELWPRIRAACDGATALGEMTTVGARRGYLKAGPLRGKASLRHAVRARLGLALPRLQEFENLSWLRANDFRAPLPLAAGGAFRHGRPVFQYLFTEEVPGAPTLRELFAGEPSALRTPALESLGSTLARLHARGFVHRDAFPRNLLVDTRAAAPRIVFLDAWRGGVRRGLRGPTYDLACLLLFAPELFSAAEQTTLLAAYFRAARQAGLPATPAASLPAVVRQRRALALRYARRGRGDTAPPPDWKPPGNLDAALS